MLEMYAFSEYVLNENRIENRNLLEKLYYGRAFTQGGWYDIEKEWESRHGEPLPKNSKDVFKALLGLPRVGEVLKPVYDDQGASYLYSLYSEFIHPAFGRPREESEAALGLEETSAFGDHRYYQALLSCNEPVQLLARDIETGSFCLQVFWHRLLEVDPFFDDKCRTAVLTKLAEQGIIPPKGSDYKDSD
jgi:hypothetical protein